MGLVFVKKITINMGDSGCYTLANRKTLHPAAALKKSGPLFPIFWKSVAMDSCGRSRRFQVIQGPTACFPLPAWLLGTT